MVDSSVGPVLSLNCHDLMFFFVQMSAMGPMSPYIRISKDLLGSQTMERRVEARVDMYRGFDLRLFVKVSSVRSRDVEIEVALMFVFRSFTET